MSERDLNKNRPECSPTSLNAFQTGMAKLQDKGRIVSWKKVVDDLVDCSYEVVVREESEPTPVRVVDRRLTPDELESEILYFSMLGEKGFPITSRGVYQDFLTVNKHYQRRMKRNNESPSEE